MKQEKSNDVFERMIQMYKQKYGEPTFVLDVITHHWKRL